MDHKTPLMGVVGPTASGKTRLAVALAHALDGEVVSADSMQIYRGLRIGTAQPTREEMQGIPHHLLDFLEPDHPFSVADYVQLAHRAIADIAARGKLPILSGGTGLYVSSLVDNMEFSPAPPSDPERRAYLEEEAQRNGNLALWERLQACDPELAGRLHPNNLGRVIRAIEVFERTGVPMSEHQRNARRRESPYQLCLLGLRYRDRALLYRRIDERVDRMLEQGLLDEVRDLSRLPTARTAAQAIGYKEFFDYLNGCCTLEEAAARVKQESRRYAKRQMTWFGKDTRIQWFYVDEYRSQEALIQDAIQYASQREVY